MRLRAIERDDIPRFLRWFNDPEIRRHLTMFRPLSRAEEERWVESLLSRRDDIVLAIEVKGGDGWVHIGNMGLHRIDWKNRAATLGIVIGEKSYWDKGYGAEAVRTMLRYAFLELGLNRVELEVFSFNLRALRCYQKAGFKREGVRRQALFRDGKFHDVILMGILRSEFSPNPSPGLPRPKGTDESEP
ncbi:GNAT family N-acetyltransferase [Candidatus Bipolaricaulota sp. J31]